MQSQLTRLITALCLVVTATIALTSQHALADKLHLKDGRVLEGRVESEGEGYIYFLVRIGTLEHRELFLTSDITKVERDDKPADVAAKNEKTEESTSRKISDGATKVAFVSLEDTVGPYLNADALLRSVEILDGLPEEEQPDIVVLRINSGGGALLEVEPLSDAIHEEMKPKFRVVGWIESAISAASMTVWNCEEIYMMPEGNVGGTVAFSSGPGGAKAAEGEFLEQILDLGVMLSERGRRDPLIMRAMQVFMTLSCDIHEDGTITWYPNDSGKELVSAEKRILTLNAADAVKYGIAKGIASTKDELAKQMGCHEWVEVGPEADEYQKEFRENVKIVEARAGELWSKMNIAVDAAGRARDESDRNREIGKARSYLRELKSLARRAPSVEEYGAGGLPPLDDEFFRNVDEQLRRIARSGT